MKKRVFIGIFILLCGISYAVAQEMMVEDSDDNLLMQVNDEGTSGSITLPQNATAPGDTANKLYNVNGVLYWNDARLSTDWTRTGTDVHLTNTGDNVGIGVAEPDAKLEVNGQVKITGGSPGADKLLTSDADGLASWETVHQPKASYVGGNSYADITANYSFYQNVKNVSITVPAGGIILASASGYVQWKSANWDLLLVGLIASHEGDPNHNWGAEDTWWDHRTIITDYNCTDDTDQYTSWSVQRGFSVSSGGTYTINVWCQKYSSSAVVTVGDISMATEYFPN